GDHNYVDWGKAIHLASDQAEIQAVKQALPQAPPGDFYYAAASQPDTVDSVQGEDVFRFEVENQSFALAMPPDYPAPDGFDRTVALTTGAAWSMEWQAAPNPSDSWSPEKHYYAVTFYDLPAEGDRGPSPTPSWICLADDDSALITVPAEVVAALPGAGL